MDKVNITKSESWLRTDIEEQGRILNETIQNGIDDNERIINIECKAELDGLSRFWIYTTNK